MSGVSCKSIPVGIYSVSFTTGDQSAHGYLDQWMFTIIYRLKTFIFKEWYQLKHEPWHIDWLPKWPSCIFLQKSIFW